MISIKIYVKLVKKIYLIPEKLIKIFIKIYIYINIIENTIGFNSTIYLVLKDTFFCKWKISKIIYD